MPELTLYTKLASRGSDFRIGGPRPRSSKFDPYRFGAIQENCERLYSNSRPELGLLRKLQDEVEIQTEYQVDRALIGPPVKEDYENLLCTTLYILNILNI